MRTAASAWAQPESSAVFDRHPGRNAGVQRVFEDEQMKSARSSQMNRTILAIDVGGSHVKMMTSKDRIKREFESGPDLTAKADGAQGQGADEGLVLRRDLDRLSRPDLRQSPAARALQSRRGMEGLRLSKGVRQTDQGRQRRADAGARRLRAAGCCFSGSAPGLARR